MGYFHKNGKFIMFTTYSREDFQSRITGSPRLYLKTPEKDLSTKYDLQKCCDWIRENDYYTICLQFPYHLLNDGTSVALYLQENLGRSVFVIADSSYGSCCIDEVAAAHVDADSVIHFGHACLSRTIKLPVLYIFEKKDLDLKCFYESCQIFEEDIIIFYDDIYHHLYPELCAVFESRSNVSISKLLVNNEKSDGKEIVSGRAFTKNPGAKVALYVGDDSVTLQNLFLSLPDFKWFQYSEKGELEECSFNRNKFLMQRNHLVEKIKEAKVIGILIGTLGIKNYLDAVDRIKLLVKSNGKKCYTIAVGKPNVAKLANFPEIDVFVYVTCLENSLLKGFKDYFKPVVSLFEMEMALGHRPYTLEYTSDFRELLPGGSFHKETKLNSEVSANSNETLQELMVKHPGSVIEYAGAEFLTNRTWRGLELNKDEVEVCKAVKGRSGIPQTYENELKTLSDHS